MEWRNLRHKSIRKRQDRGIFTKLTSIIDFPGSPMTGIEESNTVYLSEEPSAPSTTDDLP
jgi:hypothetical protein